MTKLRRRVVMLFAVLLVGAVSFMLPACTFAQPARNPQGTLFGQNEGDFIILQWDINDSAIEYFVYRSTSANGPWGQTSRFSQGAARTGGAKVDYTPDARLMDLCYKVEALDANGRVIELYEPICVLKFVPEKKIP